MALVRRSGARFEQNIWPGFVDALTALLLILMFVLSIFMIVQFSLRETITGQDRKLIEQQERIGQQEETIALQESRLDRLTADLAELSDVLALERRRNDELAAEVGNLRSTLRDERAEVARLETTVAGLTARLDASEGEVDRLTAALAAMTDAREAAVAEAQELRADLSEEVDARQALAQALAEARSEIDAQAEAARLAAARRQALEVVIEDLRREQAERETRIAALTATAEERAERIEALEAQSDARAERIGELMAELTAEEEARIVEAAAAEALRRRLAEQAESLDTTSLALEEARRRAEETLTLLAAARAAEADRAAELEAARARIGDLEARVEARTEDIDRQAQLLALAESELAEAEQATLEEARKVEQLNIQLRELREQLSSLQGLLDAAEERDREAQVQIEQLGQRLNAALAQQVSRLARFRSVFFERMEEVLGGRQDIRRVGDRFVFQSEVLFALGSAELGPAGREELSKLGAVLRDLEDEVPEDIDWILRVDGHTDRQPYSGRYGDNWGLSTARALSVVRYLIDVEGVSPERLAATGFGEFRPVDDRTAPEAFARNRRIEFKFTER